MLPDRVNINDTWYRKFVETPPQEAVQYYQLIVGQEYTPPCPAVVVLKDDPHTKLDEQWQYFVRAINYKMSIQHVSQLYEKGRAFFNRTGFPGKHNWLTGEDADEPNPNADKVRSCLLNVVTGTESGSNLIVKVFDSRNKPPLKPGRSYPRTVSEINIDDYLITPKTNREMFVVGNIISTDGKIVPFPNGAIYDYIGDGRPYSFLPLIANLGYGQIVYPMSKVKKLPLGSTVPSPYR